MMKNAVFALIALVVAVATFSIPGAAAAASKEETFRFCAQQVEKEFGASPVEFRGFRRNDGRQMAFGTITLSDGSKRQIRCRVRKGRLMEMKFRTGGRGTAAWSEERPAAAVYVDPEEQGAEGKPTDEAAAEERPEAAPSGDGEASEETSEAGDGAPSEDEAAAASTDGEAATESEAAAGGETGTESEAAAGGETGTESETAAGGEKDAEVETAASGEAEEETLPKPKFIKVPEQ